MRGISLANVDATSRKILQSSFVSSEASQLTSMDELHFLMLDGFSVHVSVPDGFSNWPRELRLLQWRGICSFSLPSHLILPSLVVLDLSRSFMLIRLWEDGAHVQVGGVVECHGVDIEQTKNLVSSSAVVAAIVLVEVINGEET